VTRKLSIVFVRFRAPLHPASRSRLYYNTTIKSKKYFNGTVWLTVVDDLDTRLTNSRTPTSVIATNLALGAEHTISGAAAGMVLRASGHLPNFQQLLHSDLGAVGVNTHSQIDAHIADLAQHRLINDSGTREVKHLNGNCGVRSQPEHLF
jgi:hypothetical protein